MNVSAGFNEEIIFMKIKQNAISAILSISLFTMLASSAYAFAGNTAPMAPRYVSKYKSCVSIGGVVKIVRKASGAISSLECLIK